MPVLSPPVYTAVVAENGKVLCVDRSRKNFVKATGNEIGPFEKFQFRHYADSSFSIFDIEGNLLRVSDSTIHLSKSKKGIPVFHTRPAGDLVWIIGSDNTYWRVDGDAVVRSGSKEQATRFTMIREKLPVPATQYLMLYLALGLILASIVMVQIPRTEKAAIYVLMAGGVCLMTFCIRLFDFLCIWDEQYHALVAKNLAEYPFRPMLLKDPVLPYHSQDWTANHVWLHKQPLFLWQMALSIRLFGPTVWAVRFPEVLMVPIMAAALYRTGMLVAGRRTGFFTALLIISSNFLFRLASGIMHTDHNDTAFLFYVSLSIWSWMEWETLQDSRKKWIFLVLTGLFSGGAVLVKWMPGLLVYAGWVSAILITKSRRKNPAAYVQPVLSLLVCLAVFLPWQIHILSAFPEESRTEMHYAVAHFSSAVEGHGSEGLGWYYYLNGFSQLYQTEFLAWVLLVPVFLAMASRKKLAFALLFMSAIVYLFFTAAATKMPAFPFMAAGIVLMVFASGAGMTGKILDLLIPFKPLRILLFTSLVSMVVLTLMKIHTILPVNYPFEADHCGLINKRSADASLYRNISVVIPEVEQWHTVVLNCPYDECPSLMFFTDLKAVYPYNDELSYHRLKNITGIRIAYMDHGDEPLPPYILSDTTVKRIPAAFLLNEYCKP